MDIFAAVAEPTRRAIIELLADEGQVSASDIARHFKSSPSAISQHLKVLRQAKVVTMKKQNRQHLYKINPTTLLELETWAKQMISHSEARFAATDTVLIKHLTNGNGIQRKSR